MQLAADADAYVSGGTRNCLADHLRSPVDWSLSLYSFYIESKDALGKASWSGESAPLDGLTSLPCPFFALALSRVQCDRNFSSFEGEVGSTAFVRVNQLQQVLVMKQASL